MDQQPPRYRIGLKNPLSAALSGMAVFVGTLSPLTAWLIFGMPALENVDFSGDPRPFVHFGVHLVIFFWGVISLFLNLEVKPVEEKD